VHCLGCCTKKSVIKHDRNSAVDIVTRYGWTVWGSKPIARGWGGGEIFRFFPPGNITEAWRWPPTPSSAEIIERIELYFYLPSVRSCHGTLLNLPLLSLSVTNRKWHRLLLKKYFKVFGNNNIKVCLKVSHCRGKGNRNGEFLTTCMPHCQV
jgi:hypothetical protein